MNWSRLGGEAEAEGEPVSHAYTLSEYPKLLNASIDRNWCKCGTKLISPI